jgi:hypothetical protein
MVKPITRCFIELACGKYNIEEEWCFMTVAAKLAKNG